MQRPFSATGLARRLRAATLMIATVLFDMNDVLVRYDKGARIAHLARTAGLTPETVEAAIWGSGFEDEGDSGASDADAYLRGFAERLGFPLTEAEWTAALKAAVTPIPETLALATAARARARVALLTNNNLLVKRTADAVFPELVPIFGRNFFVSAEFGARKPAPAAYLGCLERLGAAPETALFVDDAPQNVAGAERAGLRAHLYRSPAELEKALDAAGLLPGWSEKA